MAVISDIAILQMSALNALFELQFYAVCTRSIHVAVAIYFVSRNSNRDHNNANVLRILNISKV